LPPGEAEPDRAAMVLRVDSATALTTVYDSELYAPGEPVRLARAWEFGAIEYGTQLRNYTYTMTPYTADSAWTAGVDSGQAIDLDHRWTFGVGWWLAGHERLQDRLDPVLGNVLIWTGGDASARVYVEETTDTFVAQTRARADTIVNQGDTLYARSLIGGGSVYFSSSGLHERTIDRNGNETHFDYQGASITPTSVRAPTPSGTDTILKIESDSAGMNYLVRSDTSGWETYRVNMSDCSGAERQITSIVAPDSTTVDFAWVGGPSCGYLIDHITQPGERKTDLGYSTGLVMDVLITHPGESDTIDLYYEAAKAVGTNTWSGHAYKPRAVDSVYAYLDGPLPSWTDNTRFYVNGWGAVRRLRDALGHETWIERGDTDFPALPTRVRYPNGREVDAVYDSDGRLDFTLDRSTGAQTDFAWDETHSQPDTISSPEGVTTVFTYDTDGNRLTEKVVGGATTTYSYDSDGLLIRIKDGLNHRDTLVYDSLGNLESQESELGHVTSYDRDALGRITATIAPDSLTKMVTYDVMGRVVIEETTNTDDDYWTRVHTTYDSIGQRTRAQAFGDTTTAAQDSMATGLQLWTYDGLGRVTVERSGFKIDTLFYDLGGNVTELRTNRGDTITMTYDLLGRLVKRVVPEVTYARDSVAMDTMPFYSAGLTIDEDSVVYTYDAVGNPLTINNRFAQITRTYTPDGLILTDEQALKNYDSGSFTTHVYNLEYAYDRDRRRVSLKHPTWLTTGRTRYAYDSEGRISSITGPSDNTYAYTYDDANRITKRTFPGAGTEGGTIFGYDDDGRLTSHVVRVDDGQTVDTLHEATLDVDSAGRVSSLDGSQTSDMTYTGLGAVETTTGLAWEGDWSYERFEMDPFGSQLRSVRIGGEAESDSVEFRNTIALGRVAARNEEWNNKDGHLEPDNWTGAWTDHSYVGHNREFTQGRTYKWDITGNPPNQLEAEKVFTFREEAKAFYSADDRLMVYQVNRDSIVHDTTAAPGPGLWW